MASNVNVEEHQGVDWDFGFIKSSLDMINQLNDIESLDDPEDLPFKSKYAARELLEGLRKKLGLLIDSVEQEDEGNNDDSITQRQISENIDGDETANRVSLESVHLEIDNLQLNQNGSNSQPDTESEEVQKGDRLISSTPLSDIGRVEIFLRYIEGKLGLNFIECEETSSGEEHLSQALQSLISKFDPNAKYAAYVHMYLLNQLGILQASRRQTDKAATVLHKAEGTYNTYKADNFEAPLFPTDLLSSFKGAADENNEQTKWVLFESEHTQTLYYLAQVHQRADDGTKAAHYCQLTLRRQLQAKQYNPVEWALNAATLSQYYITENDFCLARHCLASAMKIFEEAGPCEVNLEEEGGLYSRSIDIKRCWVKYGLSLLELSWLRLLADESVPPSDAGDEKNADFFDLELTLFESWMPSKYLLDFEQARPVFLKIQDFITEAKQLYTIDNFCSDYIELVQDYSRVFKNLSVFEINSDRRSKMHKRRVDMLEEVTNELNPQYYLLVWRQLVYETAEAYSAMVDCKVDLMRDSAESRPSPHAITKLNSLCEKSVHKYLEYVSSLKTPQGELPDPLPEGDERPALVAWFCIARLYYKMIKPEKSQRIECVSKTLLYYKLVVDACDKNASYAQAMEAELPVCREMASLLAVKIDKMKSQSEQYGN